MNEISQIRGYEYDLLLGVWSADFPALFRTHSPMRIPNQRHMLISCADIDKDPKLNDLAILSGWGTGLGVDFQGQIGVVTNRSRFSQYYYPQLDSNGKPRTITRQYIGNASHLGKLINYFFPEFIFTWALINVILGSRRTPVTGQPTELQRFLALNKDYSIHPEHSRFGPTRVNLLNLSYGFENTYTVS